VNEDTFAIGHTRLRDVHRNGPKPVFRLFLADGKCIEATADHRFFFQGGWRTLAEETGLRLTGDLAVWRAGDYFLHVNGQEVEVPALYQNKAWLNHRYNVEKSKIQDIAEECGVSYHTIRKWLREHNIQHEKGGRSKAPWNHGARYRLGPRVVSDSWRIANLRARAGSASNFWRGGVTADRANIGRWTTQVAPRLHARNHWTCQLCGQRSGELRAHHIVPVWAEAALALSEQNLTTLCALCHRQVHLNELAYVEKLGGPPVKADWKKRPRVAWNKLTKTRLVRLEAITYVGIKETYDLEVEGPFHNFIANGIVTHNSVNEYSTRYSMAIDAAQRTLPHAWRKQAENNRQGSSGVLDAGAGAAFTKQEEELQEYARAVYQERLAAGIAREQARKDLPLATYTEAYWKIDLHNLLHFLSLRMEAHAQLEIRTYAETIGREIVARWVPLAWEAFVDYRLSALSLSRLESDILAALGAGDPARAVELATAAGWLARGDGGALKRHREREECEEKLGRLGHRPPWAS
jgi:thymidylate synthase (FAD)